MRASVHRRCPSRVVGYAPRGSSRIDDPRHGRAQLRWCRCRQSVRGNDSGHRRRHEARAVEALDARRGRRRGDRRGELGGVDRFTARDGELGSGRHAAGRRERDPAHRHDELHRLVQPLELHRGPGPERDGHDLPAARPDRLHEEGGVLHRRRLGEVVEDVERTARRGRSSCARTRSGPTASR